eukprot:COSAG02_NODE_1385_length_12954_cov_3.484250_1_plen_482_part_00
MAWASARGDRTVLVQFVLTVRRGLCFGGVWITHLALDTHVGEQEFNKQVPKMGGRVYWCGSVGCVMILVHVATVTAQRISLGYVALVDGHCEIGPDRDILPTCQVLQQCGTSSPDWESFGIDEGSSNHYPGDYFYPEPLATTSRKSSTGYIYNILKDDDAPEPWLLPCSMAEGSADLVQLDDPHNIFTGPHFGVPTYRHTDTYYHDLDLGCCSGHGTCNGAGSCECESSAYTGALCETFDDCHGIDCGHNGWCVRGDITIRHPYIPYESGDTWQNIENILQEGAPLKTGGAVDAASDDFKDWYFDTSSFRQGGESPGYCDFRKMASFRVPQGSSPGGKCVCKPRYFGDRCQNYDADLCHVYTRPWFHDSGEWVKTDEDGIDRSETPIVRRSDSSRIYDDMFCEHGTCNKATGKCDCDLMWGDYDGHDDYCEGRSAFFFFFFIIVLSSVCMCAGMCVKRTLRAKVPQQRSQQTTDLERSLVP